jgi:hypothetical protein
VRDGSNARNARLAYATPVPEAAAAQEEKQKKDDENGCHAFRTAGGVPQPLSYELGCLPMRATLRQDPVMRTALYPFGPCAHPSEWR